MSTRVRPGTLVFLAAATATGGCSTTRLQSTWRAPDAAPLALLGRRVVAFVDVLDALQGRSAEVALAMALSNRGVVGVAAHTLIPESERRDPELIRARLTEAGITGVVIMRVTQVLYPQPASGPTRVGSTYGGFDDAWDTERWRTPTEHDVPPNRDTRVYVHTDVYSVAQGKLVWSGETRSKKPADIFSLMTQLVDATVRALERDGLLASVK
jgi:hypothetical protein